MFVELHILQNFAPSNLNRDDTGAPKDCEFGGYRRARISSQCLKRAIRTSFRDRDLLPRENLAARTKRASDEVTRRLVERGRPESAVRPVVEAALRGVGLGLGDDGKTQYLLFLGESEFSALTEQCEAHWDKLAAVVAAAAAAEEKAVGKKQGGKDAKKLGKEQVPADVAQALLRVLDGGKAADLALFGRMLADLPNKNVDAACQVAHALSTNRVSMEFDFYTAVDDLKPEDTAGADMLGTVEFNSACFYRYAAVDLGQLRKNLGDPELAGRTLAAFLRASVEAVPTGKQNSMAAQNPPSFVFAVARQAGLWSMANAFLRPVAPERGGDLVQSSVHALDRYWGRLAAMYGEQDIAGKWACTLEDQGLEHLQSAVVHGADGAGALDRLVASVVEAARFGGGPGGA